MSSAAGNDLLFDEALCQQGKGFGNKIWNAFRLIQGWKVDDIEQPKYAKTALDWYTSKFQKVLSEIEDHFGKYRLSDALMSVYKLVWYDFCSWLLEMIKPVYGEAIDRKTYHQVVDILEQNLKIPTPFYAILNRRNLALSEGTHSEQALIVSCWPVSEPINTSLLEEFEFASEVISGIRNLRKENKFHLKLL